MTGGIYVPGVFACPKCKFRLHKVTLFMGNGVVGADDTPGDPCPNCETNLWRVSWKDEASEAYQVAETQIERALAAEARVRELEAAARPITTAIEQNARIYQRCVEIADQVVPKYRDGKRSYSCCGPIAKRWASAFDAAMIAISGTKA